MPRSFLVKKPSSTRVPNYGRLETRHCRRRRDPSDPSQGLEGPLLLQNGLVPPAAPCEAGSPWDPSPVIACLSRPLPQKSELRGDPERSLQGSAGATVGRSGSSLAWGAPLRDSQNHLPLPSAFSLPQRRTPSPGSPAEGEGSRVLGEPSVAATATAASAPLEWLKCSDCRKPGRSFVGLARPRQARCKPVAAPVARKYFSCKHCEKEYVSLGALKMHIRTHTLPCVCKICGKAFSRPWLLQGHIRTHTGEKPYACSHCSRAFADRSNLRAHLQTHSDIKKYQCHACLKTFSRMSLLLRHEEASCCPPAT
uniref:Zinc finger protein SNAI3 n=1 Tax=Pogona vitticeps TaxID=103695 RepID=A0ABM5EUI3_9SAUR